MSIYDDIFKHKIFVQRVGLNEAKRILKINAKAQKVVEKFIFDNGGNVTVEQLKQLVDTTRKLLFTQTYKANIPELERFAKYEADMTYKILNNDKNLKGKLSKAKDKDILKALNNKKVTFGSGKPGTSISDVYQSLSRQFAANYEKLIYQGRAEATSLANKAEAESMKLRAEFRANRVQLTPSQKQVQDDLETFINRKEIKAKIREKYGSEVVRDKKLKVESWSRYRLKLKSGVPFTKASAARAERILKAVEAATGRGTGLFFSSAKTTGTTIYNHISQIAMTEVFEVNKNVIPALRWDTLLDDRVCAYCESLEGQVWPIGEQEDEPPAHGNCRCALIPTEIEEIS